MRDETRGLQKTRRIIAKMGGFTCVKNDLRKAEEEEKCR